MITTITIPGRKRRTADGRSLEDLYDELTERVLEALNMAAGKTHDDYDPSKHPHQPAGSSKGGQFASVVKAGVKPTSASTMVPKHAAYELLSSGHPFTLNELLEITGHTNANTMKSFISFFKNPKTAPKAGALDIKKLPNGAYQVVTSTGEVATALTTEGSQIGAILTQTMPVDTPAKQPSKSAKDLASAEYDQKMTFALFDMGKEIQKAFDQGDLSAANFAVLEYKTQKAHLMAKWSEAVHGIAKAPMVQQLFKADNALALDLFNKAEKATAGTWSATLKDSIIQWKTNTLLEKQGKYPPVVKTDKPATTPTAVMASTVADLTNYKPVAPKNYDSLVPSTFEPIGPKDIVNGKFQSGILALKELLSGLSGSNIGNKKSVATKLSERLKDSHNFIQLKKALNSPQDGSIGSLESKLVKVWAGSSGDSNPISCALQLAVRDGFAQPTDAVSFKALASVAQLGEDKTFIQGAYQLGLKIETDEQLKTFKAGLQEFVHAQYHETQDLLSQHGIKDVYLARGMKLSTATQTHAGPSKLKLQPASSFSANYSTAKSFASGGTVYLTKVPASQVLSTYMTGFGCTSEHEVVVLGHHALDSYSLPSTSAASATSATEKLREVLSAFGIGKKKKAKAVP